MPVTSKHAREHLENVSQILVSVPFLVQCVNLTIVVSDCLFSFHEALDSTPIDHLPFRLGLFASCFVHITRIISIPNSGLLFACLISPLICFVS